MGRMTEPSRGSLRAAACHVLGVAILLLVGTSVRAQERGSMIVDDYAAAQPARPTRSTTLPTPANSQTARSVAGQAGRRVAREQVGVVPMARFDSRIRNRVQSRIRNRIDRNYTPSANAAAPFEVAGAQRGTTRTPRR